MEISRGIPQFQIHLGQEELFHTPLPRRIGLARSLRVELIDVDPNNGSFKLGGFICNWKEETLDWKMQKQVYRDVSEVPGMPEEIQGAINCLLQRGVKLAQEARELGSPC
jgi:hypothetical protein